MGSTFIAPLIKALSAGELGRAGRRLVQPRHRPQDDATFLLNATLQRLENPQGGQFAPPRLASGRRLWSRIPRCGGRSCPRCRTRIGLVEKMPHTCTPTTHLCRPDDLAVERLRDVCDRGETKFSVNRRRSA
jgi:hypothetical protein